jgi:hypothetical protein
VGPRIGLHDVEKRKFFTLPGLELLPLRRSARSQFLYRLRYSGSLLHVLVFQIHYSMPLQLSGIHRYPLSC